MSVAIEGKSSEVRSRCVQVSSILFPLVCLIVSLVGYAAFGALLFYYIEGPASRPSGLQEEYKDFLLTLVKTVRNSSENVSSIEQDEFVKKLHGKMLQFDQTWLQSPNLWSFFGSMFFCCTVFTTIGYGNMFPVTDVGKMVCVLYAMGGIPLMLLVITDVGDILAILVSKAYLRVHKLCSRPCSCSWFSWRSLKKPVEEGIIHEAAYSCRQDVMVQAPMDIRQVLRNQSSVRRKSTKLYNAEIFDRIIARGNLARNNLEKQRGLATLTRYHSCPNLNQLEPQRDLWDLRTGEELEKLDVPLILILVLVFTYVLFGAVVLPQWEDIGIFNAFYFCFITLTTIGFGDIVPEHPKFFMLTFLFIITGMAILTMAFKLGQSRFVSCYRQFIRSISGGKVQRYE